MWTSKRYPAALICVILMIQPAEVWSDESSEERDKRIVAAATSYLRARSVGDLTAIKNAAYFGDDSDLVALEKMATEVPHASLERNLDYEGQVHLVAGPGEEPEGEFLLLVPYRDGYFPRRLRLKMHSGGYKVLFESLRDDGSRDLKPGDSLADDVMTKARRWERLHGRDLQMAIEENKRMAKDVILGLEFAREHNLQMYGGYPALEECQRQLRLLETLPPEEIRAINLRKMAEVLREIGVEPPEWEDGDQSSIPGGENGGEIALPVNGNEEKSLVPNEDLRNSEERVKSGVAAKEKHQNGTSSGDSDGIVPFAVALALLAAIMTSLVLLKRK